MTKFPARLIIQVWDNNIISTDDFLGETPARGPQPQGGEVPASLTPFLWVQGSWNWICQTCPSRPRTPGCALSECWRLTPSGPTSSSTSTRPSLR